MNNAEQIREFYRDNPEVSRAEAAQQLGIKDTTVRAMVSKDVKAGRAIYTETGGVDYSHYFNTNTAKKELMESKNSIRWELIDHLMNAVRKETDGDKLSKLSDKVDKLLKEITE